jgi:hypothetical protein
MFDHKQANCLCLNGKYSWKAPTRTFLKRKGNRLYRRASKQQLSSIIDEQLPHNEESEMDYFLPFDTMTDEQVSLFDHLLDFDLDPYNDEYLDELCAIHDYMEG